VGRTRQRSGGAHAPTWRRRREGWGAGNMGTVAGGARGTLGHKRRRKDWRHAVSLRAITVTRRGVDAPELTGSSCATHTARRMQCRRCRHSPRHRRRDVSFLARVRAPPRLFPFHVNTHADAATRCPARHARARARARASGSPVAALAALHADLAQQQRQEETTVPRDHIKPKFIVQRRAGREVRLAGGREGRRASGPAWHKPFFTRSARATALAGRAGAPCWS
jgi:hypothetical protein